MIQTVIRTYLEMRRPGDLIGVPLDGADLRVDQVRDCPVAFHRFLYVSVGSRYHWKDRLAWSDGQWRGYLDDPAVSLHVLYRRGAPAGYYELRRDPDGAIEIAYFGLLPEFLRQGLGKRLLTHAVETAWREGADRVWLHTCTLDDPAALPNYRRRGFVPFREESYQQEIP